MHWVLHAHAHVVEEPFTAQSTCAQCKHTIISHQGVHNAEFIRHAHRWLVRAQTQHVALRAADGVACSLFQTSAVTFER